MKVSFNLGSGVTVYAEGETGQEIFDQIAELQEVFQHSGCGMSQCGSPHVRFTTREATSGKKTYTYHELRCLKCGARLSFGHSEGGKLYPKRTWNSLAPEDKSEERKTRAHQKQYADEHYGQLPDKGWYKWVKPKED